MTTGGRYARRELAWGGVDQGLSSATNFGLSLLAGRLIGAGGLGVVYLGFSAYLIFLSFVRALVFEPMVIASASRDEDERAASARAALTLVLAVAGAVLGLMLVAGLLIPGAIGRGLVLFAPWTAGALVQDFWRAVLFRDGRGRAAACNDAVWAIGMAVMLPVALSWPNESTLAATWGAGATLAAAVGFAQTRIRPGPLAPSFAWWWHDARGLGSWLALENAILAAGNQGLAFVLAAQLGASDLGGIRVIEVAFAPMSLIGEAIAFPGLPLIARSLAVSPAEARRAAWRLGAGAAALVGAYLLVVIPARERLLSVVFGDEFLRFAALVVPVAIAQLLRAQSLGFALLLKADRRVRAVVVSQAVPTVGSIVLTPVLAYLYGAAGAMWGLAFRPALTALLTIWWGGRPADIRLPGRSALAARIEA
jgi:O-antigen/teichoic acid export membrane protein